MVVVEVVGLGLGLGGPLQRSDARCRTRVFSILKYLPNKQSENELSTAPCSALIENCECGKINYETAASHDLAGETSLLFRKY